MLFPQITSRNQRFHDWKRGFVVNGDFPSPKHSLQPFPKFHPLAQFLATSVLLSAGAAMYYPKLASAETQVNSMKVDIEKENQKMMISDLEQRGKQLRADIESTYREMAKNKTLQSGQNILSAEIVTKSIPSGTALEDAQAIMKSAGFETSIKELTPHNSGLTGWTVLDKPFFAKVEFGMSVYPKIPNDFHSGVGKAGGAIFVSNL